MIRLIWIAASLRAGGMRIRVRDVLTARRGPATYETLRGVFRPSAREMELFDAVVLAALDTARVLPPPSVRTARGHR